MGGEFKGKAWNREDAACVPSYTSLVIGISPVKTMCKVPIRARCSPSPWGSWGSWRSWRQLRYTDLALARRDLESSQMGAAWEHFSKCRPLSKKYGASVWHGARSMVGPSQGSVGPKDEDQSAFQVFNTPCGSPVYTPTGSCRYIM